MSKFIDYTGKSVDRLTVLERVPTPAGKSGAWWRCRCICGKEVIRGSSTLGDNRSSVRSCGCYGIEKTGELNRARAKHDHNRRGKRTRTYTAWSNMRRRCSPEGEDAKFYYDRGIRVCERWREFTNFLEDMGECPPDLTLERRDVNGNYEKDNCYWASWDVQHNNTRSNYFITVKGEKLTLAQASRKYEVNYGSLHSRIYMLGLDPETAIFGNGGEICPLKDAHKGGKPIRFKVSKELAV